MYTKDQLRFVLETEMSVLSELSVGAEKHRSSIAEETAHVLPALPFYVRIQEKTLNLARLPDFLLPRLREAFQRTFRYTVQ